MHRNNILIEKIESLRKMIDEFKVCTNTTYKKKLFRKILLLKEDIELLKRKN